MSAILLGGGIWDRLGSAPAGDALGQVDRPLPSLPPEAIAGAVNLPAASQVQPYYVCSTNLYVDTVNGNDSNDGKSAARAYRTIAYATWRNASFGPNVCVNVAPGTYYEFVRVNNALGLAGNGAGYAVLRSTTPLGAQIVGPNTGGYSVVALQASYAVIDGFDVSGGASGGHCIDGGVNWQTNHAHHLIAINNHTHDCGGAGISFVGGDYYIIDGNAVDHTAATNGYQASGISIASAFPMNLERATYHNVVRNNISHDNVERFDCAMINAGSGCHSDGEGIIIDCFDCGWPGGPQPFSYPYATLVTGNVTYRNGGNGIQVGRTSNVVVGNNIAYNNMLDSNNSGSARSELGCFHCSHTIFVNNIARAILQSDYSLLDEGQGNQEGVAYSSIKNVWANNLYFGGRGLGNQWADADGVHALKAASNIGADSQLVVGDGAPIGLSQLSPAIAAGLPEGWLTTAPYNVGPFSLLADRNGKTDEHKRQSP